MNVAFDHKKHVPNNLQFLRETNIFCIKQEDHVYGEKIVQSKIKKRPEGSE